MNEHPQKQNNDKVIQQEPLPRGNEQHPGDTKTHNSMRSMLFVAGAVLLVMLCFTASYLGTNLGSKSDDPSTTSITSFENTKGDGNTVVTDTEKGIASLVESVSPSVVSIITTSGNSSLGYEYRGAGTGMIVSSDGYIMTNKHVVDSARSATVVANDGTTYENVEVVGKDPLNDIAFLKIEGETDLPAVKLGDSKTVRTGQQVIAIGNALGQYQNTVTTGIVSGLGRPVVASTDGTSAGAESLTDLIQTDAAINQGNSGGPLLNIKGQVVAINTAVATDAQGIGFAIPIGAAKGMIKGLIETGKVERAIVGVRYVSITPEVKAEYKTSVLKGDLVTGLSDESSPAAKAGVEKNDVIIAVNGQETGPGKGVATLVSEFQPGDTVTLTLLRGDSEKTVKVTLGSY